MLSRVLPLEPIVSLADYEKIGGGRGLDAARRLGPTGVIEELSAAGLRGRGGAGFPTGQKWDTVRSYASAEIPATVVVNGAEGEPGSFKDRVLLRTNPYAVVEGALIAAGVVGAVQVVIAVKHSFANEARALQRAIGEVVAAGWTDAIDVVVFEGPAEYLYGEETALLEAIDGRQPFPRVAPPYRHGVEEMVEAPGESPREPAFVVMADRGDETTAPPTLVNNVETMANVPAILAEGADWFREVGTDESPGTIVCTVSGCTRSDGVGEFAMGTPLRTVIDELGGGARPGHRIVGAMSGVANPIVLAESFDAPVSYEGMQAIGSGLGAAGFIVFDDTTDFAALAHGVSRFLAVESCGQCSPCKQDGLAVAELLDRIRRSEATELEVLAIDDHLRTITEGARCFLAHQHQRVVGSIVAAFADELRAHVDGRAKAADAELIAPITDIADGDARIDERQREKQPDWSFDPIDSGKAPVERLGDPADYAP
jgi:NADH:ubiquinone oxidoreductase subunit F (NADH-binding)